VCSHCNGSWRPPPTRVGANHNCQLMGYELSHQRQWTIQDQSFLPNWHHAVILCISDTSPETFVTMAYSVHRFTSLARAFRRLCSLSIFIAVVRTHGTYSSCKKQAPRPYFRHSLSSLFARWYNWEFQVVRSPVFSLSGSWLGTRLVHATSCFACR